MHAVTSARQKFDRYGVDDDVLVSTLPGFCACAFGAVTPHCIRLHMSATKRVVFFACVVHISSCCTQIMEQCREVYIDRQRLLTVDEAARLKPSSKETGFARMLIAARRS